ncbi:mechanosensitive ion channel family protein [Haliangium ochraceum]|uniref:MscS Mechanosensitive ion channel n=1 Tax=Haliangium ochraceum (strain DSM 14365 / JCM 11303 / SMP-2) TaxID=502025 RepID=D0LU57_HALO1|nr:mechanosensitive ion channel family protein [Haliangium ochraceum]ACY17421.1 MscS Mechanosensitive ion channel [Haliangium ochraceum DSM 14365]
MEMEILEYEYYGNSVRAYLYALGIALAIFVSVRLFRTLIVRRIRKYAEHTDTNLDDMVFAVLDRTRTLLVMVLAVCAGASTLALPEWLDSALPIVGTTALLLQLGFWASAAVRFTVDARRSAHETDGEVGSVAAIGLMGMVASGVVWAIVAMLLLDNFGVDVTALITGLGIGGIAVALAVQKILSDLFASVSIILDKPFQVGDFVIVGDYMGTVERIGVKTTRFKSLGGEQLVFANSDLVNARLRNYKRMEERRIVFSLGTLYQTPADKVAAIPGMIREAIEAQEQARFDRAHFKEYGDSALVFEAVYYVTVPDYNAYMDVQQAINMDIMRQFQSSDIEFAFPTRTIFLEGPEGAEGERDQVAQATAAAVAAIAATAKSADVTDATAGNASATGVATDDK